ncbi:outer membrane protein OmpA-like peptidoglycan-associated protein [Azospirillum agricola]|uniref:caspase family protein n=1 Tax=Azospirillum agricola TaxID=1720247 RepID=UPI001AEB0FDA|nr:caspase family protein [Azospirillum agricola]MBP2230037.1 outer membrane protein OmpA-like peptidoglycan-associated protein [Azospirillum agricola]
MAALLLVCLPARAEPRVALVVGIGRYEQQDSLRNPPNDAAAMARTLAGLGFELIGGGPQIDPDRARLLDLLRTVGDRARGALALVYIAGHGAQHQGRSYVLPRDDGRIRYREDLPDWAVSVDGVLDRLDGAATALLLFDTCRNVALPARNGDRTAVRGLARLERTPPQSMVVFATQAGAVAADGDGTNSPFAQGLVELLATPGVEVGLLMRRVRDRVSSRTDGRQKPEIVVNLGGDEIYLAHRPPPRASVPPQARDDQWSGLESGKAYLLPVLQNDSAMAEGELHVASVDTPSSGQAAVSDDGRQILFTAPANADGYALFSYRVREDGGGEARARVTLSYTQPPSHRVSSILPGSGEDLAVNVGDRVFFATGRSDISPEAVKTLNRQAAWLMRYSTVTVVIEGHDDERSSRSQGMEVSRRRAGAVKEYLVSQGVASNRISVIGYGKERPAVIGGDDIASSQNRRAVMVVN